jgi:hypothetical protein
MTLDDLLAHADSSDYYEEEAQEYLEDNHIPITSHDRKTLYIQAWKAGWRP